MMMHIHTQVEQPMRCVRQQGRRQPSWENTAPGARGSPEARSPPPPAAAGASSEGSPGADSASPSDDDMPADLTRGQAEAEDAVPPPPDAARQVSWMFRAGNADVATQPRAGDWDTDMAAQQPFSSWTQDAPAGR